MLDSKNSTLAKDNRSQHKKGLSQNKMDALANEIKKLARKKQALILAHNYQLPEVQDLADMTGDSLALSIQASKTDAKIIVFCGVKFMAETAAIVCPDKKVLLPSLNAGCAMADMLTADDLKTLKKKHPGVPVITYVNSSAEAKAESYICCTSANAVQVAHSIKTPELIMAPDRNLARWTQKHTDQKIHIWDGYCPIHDELTAETVRETIKKHPQAMLIAHPECHIEVLEMADAVKSTSGMLEYVAKSPKKEFIIATEVGLLHTLQKQNPDKVFYPVSTKMVCDDMKQTTLETLLNCLEQENNMITVREDIRQRAYKVVARMLVVPRD